MNARPLFQAGDKSPGARPLQVNGDPLGQVYDELAPLFFVHVSPCYIHNANVLSLSRFFQANADANNLADLANQAQGQQAGELSPELSLLVQALRLSNGPRETAVPTFNRSDAAAWVAYESKFLATAVANGWLGDNVSTQTDARARALLFAALSGEAAALVAHIRPGDSTSLLDLLKAFRQCFVPLSNGPANKAAFRAAKQTSGEPLSKWHARVRALYQLAYPEGDVDSEDLSTRFVEGLLADDIHIHLMSQHGRENWEYQDFLEHATLQEAARTGRNPGGSINAIRPPGRGGSSSAGRPAPSAAPSATVHLNVPANSWLAANAAAPAKQPWATCFLCMMPGHVVRDCAGLAHCREYRLKISGSTNPRRSDGQPAPARGSSRGRGGPGRGRGRGRGQHQQRGGGHGVFGIGTDDQDHEEQEDEELFPEGH